MSEINQITFPAQGERTQSAFLEQMAAELGEAHREVLGELTRALTERGWIEAPEALVAKLAEHAPEATVREALAELARRRLVDLDPADGHVTGLLGCLSAKTTEHRAHLPSGVDLHTIGGFDLLSLSRALSRDLDVFTKCPQSGRAIQLKLSGEQIVEANINGIAGFLANWDGVRALADVARDSPLFASDADLEAWQAAHPDIDGMALPGDLLLWVGMSGAMELADARAKLIGRPA